MMVVVVTMVMMAMKTVMILDWGLNLGPQYIVGKSTTELHS